MGARSTAAPTITSALTATGAVLTAFTYQITATNSPSSFSAAGLPVGLTVDTATGAITGTPLLAGTTSVTISATNLIGTGSATLALTVTGTSATAPVITSYLGGYGTVGTPFTYQITASDDPASFAATGLPAGLTVSSATGEITGIPTVAGNTQVTISATNALGTGSATLSLLIVNPAGSTSDGANFFKCGGGSGLAALVSALVLLMRVHLGAWKRQRGSAMRMASPRPQGADAASRPRP